MAQLNDALADASPSPVTDERGVLSIAQSIKRPGKGDLKLPIPLDGSAAATSTATGALTQGNAPTGEITELLVSTTDASGTYAWSAGHTFKKGEVPEGDYVAMNSASFQFVPISYWDDGSVKHASVAGTAALVQGVASAVRLSHGANPGGASLTEQSLIDRAPQASITYGTYGTINLSALLGTSARAITEHAGPQYISFQYIAAFPNDSAVRAVFYVQLWANNAYRVRIAVECGVPPRSGADKSGLATITINSVQVFNQTVNMRAGCRWDVVGSSAPIATVQPNAAYLRSTRLVPNYGYTSPSSAALDALLQTYAQMGIMGWAEHQGAIGYDPGIGLLPHWDALYCTTGDLRALRSCLEHGRAYGSYAIYYRDSSTRAIPRFTDWPTSSMQNEVGGELYGEVYIWEVNHVPNAGYLPWLLTAERFYLEVMQANAWGCYYVQTPNNSPAPYQNALRAYTSQTRGRAWKARTIGCAAAVSPQGDGFAADARANLVANFQRWRELHVVPNTPATGLIGINSDNDNDDPEMPPGFQHSIFESLFFTATMGWLWDVEPGLTEQQKQNQLLVRDFVYRVPVGLLGRGQARAEYGWPRATGPYRMTIGPNEDDSSVLYQTWYEIEIASHGADNFNAAEGQPMDPTMTGFADDSSASAFPTGNWGHVLSAIAWAVSHGFLGAQASFDRLTGASNWTSNANKFNDWPQYGMLPRVLNLPYALPTFGSAVMIGTNSSNDVCPPDMTVTNWDYANFNGFGAGIFVEDYSEAGAFATASNGSHQAPSSSDGLIFDALDATYKRLPDSLGAPNFNTDFSRDITSGTPWFDLLGFGETPAGSHLYNTTAQLPRKLGGGPKGSFMKLGMLAVANAPPPAAFTGGGSHKLDLSNGVWSRVSPTAIMRIAEQYEQMTAYDEVRGRYYFVVFNQHLYQDVNYLDGFDLTPKFTTPGYIWPPDDTAGSNYGVMFVDQRHGLLIIQRAASRMLALQLNNIAAGWTRLVEGNEGARPAAPNRLHLWPRNGCFYTKQNNGQTIIKLTPPDTNPLTEPWVWSNETVAGATLADFTLSGQSGNRRHYNHFVYAPRLDCFMWLPGGASRVYLIRPQL